MTTDTTSITTQALEEKIHKAIADYVAREVAKAIEEAKKRLDAEIPAITAAIGVEIQRVMDAMGSDAVLQIRMKPRLG